MLRLESKVQLTCAWCGNTGAGTCCFTERQGILKQMLESLTLQGSSGGWTWMPKQ